MRTCLAIIWSVTAYDCWACQWLTLDGELNPMSATILAAYGVWTLVALKIVGTFIVTELLRSLPPVYLVGVTGAQLSLLAFLTLN